MNSLRYSSAISYVALSFIHPSSARGTKRGQERSKILMEASMSFIFFEYAWLLIVARVPITPTFLFLVFKEAIFAPGSIIPIIGISKLFFKIFSATEETVLQATTRALIFLCIRNLASCRPYSMTVSFDLDPYGTLAVSPK